MTRELPIFHHPTGRHPVRFAYTADREVIREVSFDLRPGTVTALVGPSGSGKSTLARLLPRFFDVSGGRITIGGRDVRKIPTDELYRMVGFVFQDVRLIRDSVRANIALARPDASDEEIFRSAAAANIHERILELPRGYESVVGEDARLSGGESQRLSIARAILADTPILVFDEATAFADPESEAAIQDALAELVAQDGLYRNMWEANESAVQTLNDTQHFVSEGTR